jgi:putative ABC transport system substrate-binding protein
VIIATGGNNSILAAKALTNTIPIVFTTGGDPVLAGLVTSLNRPGGNLTGVSWFASMLGGKALGLLNELVSNAALIGLMVNSKNRESETTQRDTQEAARALGQQLLVLDASTPSDIDTVFGTYGNGTPARSSSLPIHFLRDDASKLSRWRRVTLSLPCTSIASLSRRAG